MTIETYVITLDTASERFRQFKTSNEHLNVEPFIGVDGSKLSFRDSVKQGFMTPDCAASGMVSPGQLGCAISHWTLWWKAVYEQKSLLILEDDAATHRDLQSWIDQSEVCRNADLMLFGINTDSVLEAVSPEGVHQITVFEDPYPDYDSISGKLSLTRTSDVRTWRLRKAFGLCCYLVTPAGATKLVEQALPLRLEGVPVPLVNDNLAGVGVDRRLTALYTTMEAYISIPFLAWSPNTDSSTRR